jgi:hypothetical protein
LINENSRHWKAAVTGAITCASEVWGGRYFLLIPTDGKRIKDKFWEILEAYSPDHIGVYRLSFADMEVADPVQYAETKQRWYDAWKEKGFGGDFEEWFGKQAEVSPLDELTISDALEQQLMARLSPFHFQDRVVLQPLSYQAGFGFPFTKMNDIISFTTRHIGQIALPKPIEDPVAALMIHSQTGLARSAYCEKLNKEGFLTTPLPNNYETSDFLEHVLGRKRPLIGAADQNRWRPSEDYMPRTPFGISMLHLVLQQRAVISVAA